MLNVYTFALFSIPCCHWYLGVKCVFTLVQLILLDPARPVRIEGLKDCLPLVYVIKKLLELVQIDRPR